MRFLHNRVHILERERERLYCWYSVKNQQKAVIKNLMLSRLAPRHTQPLIQRVSGTFPMGKMARAWLRLSMSRTTPLPPTCACLACDGTIPMLCYYKTKFPLHHKWQNTALSNQCQSCVNLLVCTKNWWLYAWNNLRTIWWTSIKFDIFEFYQKNCLHIPTNTTICQ